MEDTSKRASSIHQKTPITSHQASKMYNTASS
jgi:chemotaxis protein CheY-P-specific phosphatase CheC